MTNQTQSNGLAAQKLASTFITVGIDIDAEAMPATDSLRTDIETICGDFQDRLSMDRSLILNRGLSADSPDCAMRPDGECDYCLSDYCVSDYCVSNHNDMRLALAEGGRIVRRAEPGRLPPVPRPERYTVVSRRAIETLCMAPGKGSQNPDQPVRPEPGV